MIASNIYGCKADTLKTILITSPKPVAAFSLKDSLSCTGVLNLVVNNLSTSATRYIWKFGDRTANSTVATPSILMDLPEVTSLH